MTSEYVESSCNKPKSKH